MCLFLCLYVFGLAWFGLACLFCFGVVWFVWFDLVWLVGELVVSLSLSMKFGILPWHIVAFKLIPTFIRITDFN